MKASILSRSRGALAVAMALAMAATSYPVFAQTKGDDASSTTTQPAATAPASSSSQATQMPSSQDRDAMKLSKDGFAVMRAVRGARISIFEGNPKVAQDMVAAAEKSLKAAERDATSLHADDKNNKSQPSESGQAANKGYIPIDGQLILVDSFVESPTKKGHVDKANEHIAKGDSKGAMDELKLAEVEATFTRVMMPLQATQKHVNAAAKLIDEKKFYEANLALKAAEDGLVLDSVALTESPNSGNQSQANSKTDSQANSKADSKSESKSDSSANSKSDPAGQQKSDQSKPKS